MCDSPIIVQPNRFRHKIPVPCGKCPPCKKRRVDSWVFRLQEEDKASSSSHFVTLTYGGNTIPISTNGFPTLRKPDLQKFFKRLRRQTGLKLRYYAVGEYGEKNDRPHYHAIIFGVKEVEAYVKAWSLPYDDYCREYGSIGVPFLARHALGQLHVGQVSGDSIAYVAKYMDKKKNVPIHDRDDRVPEFSVMSKGLGQSYLTAHMKEYHRRRIDQLYLVKRGGFRIAMPKYYREQIWDDDEKALQLRLIYEACELRDYELDKKAARKGLSLEAWKRKRAEARYLQFQKRNSKNRKL